MVDRTGGLGVDDEVIVIEVDLGVQVVDDLLDEMREVIVLLDGRGKLDVLDEFRPCFAVYFGLEFIAVVEAFAE